MYLIPYELLDNLKFPGIISISRQYGNSSAPRIFLFFGSASGPL